LQPCIRYKPEQQQQQQQQRHSVGGRGTVGLRGRRKYVLVGLVAASMRLTPRKPTVPRLRQFPAAVGNGGCRHAGLLVGVDLGRHGASAASDSLLLFFFLSVVGRAQGTVKGGAGGPCRGVGAMDGAIELTGTYLQRPLHGPPAPPTAAFDFSIQPRGAQPLAAANTGRVRLSASPSVHSTSSSMRMPPYGRKKSTRSQLIASP